MKTVTITHRKGSDNESVREITLQESNRTGMNWRVPKGSDGYHFASLKSVKKFFKRKYPNADIDIG